MTPERKGSERYATLPARDLLPVQVSHLRARFELAPQSYLGEAVARMTNEAAKAGKSSTGSSGSGRARCSSPTRART